MSPEQMPKRSRVSPKDWEARFAEYQRRVDQAYADLRNPRIDPRDPAGTLRRMFGDAILAEAQIAQVVSASLGKGFTELVSQGVPLEQLIQIELSTDDARKYAAVAKDVHDLLGIPHIPEAAMATVLKDVVFPLAGMGSSLNGISSLDNGRILPQSQPGIVEFEDQPPSPQASLPDVQRFFAADPRNSEIARRAFKVSLNTLLVNKEERDKYHKKLAHPALADLSRAERQAALLGIRAEFGGKMIRELTHSLTPTTVPGASERQLFVFANNIVAYVRLPEGPPPNK